MATLIQLLQTQKSNIDAGLFSWRRWAIVNSVIVCLIAAIQLIGDTWERMSVMAFVGSLILAGVTAKRAAEKKLNRYDALSAGVIVFFGIAIAILALTKSSSNAPWLFFLPLGVMLLLFTFMIFRERLQR